MTFLWLHSSFLNLDHLAKKLYGKRSRLHTQRLRKKLVGMQRWFEPWEVAQLEQLKQEVLGHLQDASRTQESSTDNGPSPAQ